MEQKQRVRHCDEAVELIERYLRTNYIPPHGSFPQNGKCVKCGG